MYISKCPICRKISNWNKLSIKENNELCCICLDVKASVNLSWCNHTTTCVKCCMKNSILEERYNNESINILIKHTEKNNFNINELDKETENLFFKLLNNII